VRLNHRVGKARSRQNFKTIADDRSLATFDGIIHVDAGADETDAMQQSNNLQLSPGARIVARPQLDIHTDEVIASHGATIGQPDPEEQRYLRTRGLDADTARSLIVGGFIIAGLAGMGSLRERAQAALLRLLGI
jgi:Fe-S cluster assembly protein SufD